MTGAAVAAVWAGALVAIGLVSWPREPPAPAQPVVAGQPALSAGERVDGLALTAVLRPDGSDGHVSFVYGDCVPADDAGCAPPAEVQIWPACRRSLTLYRDPASGVPAEEVTIRGAPGLSFDRGRRLELQTGHVTVVVFADSRDRAARLVTALSTADGAVAPGRPLPPPAEDALEGVVDC